jgi:hypothetical protein
MRCAFSFIYLGVGGGGCVDGLEVVSFLIVGLLFLIENVGWVPSFTSAEKCFKLCRLVPVIAAVYVL